MFGSFKEADAISRDQTTPQQMGRLFIEYATVNPRWADTGAFVSPAPTALPDEPHDKGLLNVPTRSKLLSIAIFRCAARVHNCVPKHRNLKSRQSTGP